MAPGDASVLSGATLTAYILDSDPALVLESDSARMLTAALARQY